MQNAVVLGTFDGIHKGHLSVLSVPKCYNKIALVFSVPPKCIKSGVTELLISPEEKQEKFEKMGFSVKTLNFNEVEHFSPNEFLEYIKNEFNPAIISCGFNYRFGFKGEGNTELLKKFCDEENIILKIADAVKENNEIISSSVIRSALKAGDIEKANRFLGYNFSFKAEIIHGDGRGRTLGIPTVNQMYPKNLCSVKYGVYKSEILIDNKMYTGITNIGKRPTYPLDYVISETFINNFNSDLYGKKLKVSLIKFLRSEKKFSSSEELRTQILKDLRC